MFVTCDVFQHRSLLKATAPSNILCILATFPVSHVDMSLSNDDAPTNMLVMSLTFRVSHVPISPLNSLALKKHLAHGLDVPSIPERQILEASVDCVHELSASDVAVRKKGI